MHRPADVGEALFRRVFPDLSSQNSSRFKEAKGDEGGGVALAEKLGSSDTAGRTAAFKDTTLRSPDVDIGAEPIFRK